jgi:hypothetical protein
LSGANSETWVKIPGITGRPGARRILNLPGPRACQ